MFGCGMFAARSLLASPSHGSVTRAVKLTARRTVPVGGRDSGVSLSPLSFLASTIQAWQEEKVERFSQLYLERGEPTKDSVRLRNRLAAFFDEKVDKQHGFACCQAYERETGVLVPRRAGYRVFAQVFTGADLRDALDAISIVYGVLETERSPLSRGWAVFVARALHEENVGYRVDGRCVVHYHVDEEFERNRAATVAALELPPLSGVRAAFEDAFRHLDAEPQDTKAAVRSMFEAVEITAKLIVPGAERLNRSLCVQKLKDACLTVSQGDATEQEVASNLFTSLGHWVEAVHDYRHGQRSQERVAPSEEIAVLILSAGTAYLRQLAIYAARMPHVSTP